MALAKKYQDLTKRAWERKGPWFIHSAGEAIEAMTHTESPEEMKTILTKHMTAMYLTGYVKGTEGVLDE